MNLFEVKRSNVKVTASQGLITSKYGPEKVHTENIHLIKTTRSSELNGLNSTVMRQAVSNPSTSVVTSQ